MPKLPRALAKNKNHQNLDSIRCQKCYEKVSVIITF